MQQGRGALATSGVRPFVAPAEAKALGIFVVPIAAVAFLARPFCKPCLAQDAVSAFVPMLFLLATIPLACAFHTSQHSQWMMDNTIPRLLWYISAVPLAVLVQKSRHSKYQRGDSRKLKASRKYTRSILLREKTALKYMFAYTSRRICVFRASFGLELWYTLHRASGATGKTAR